MILRVDHLGTAVVEFDGQHRRNALARLLGTLARGRIGGCVAPVIDQIDQRAALVRLAAEVEREIDAAIAQMEIKAVLRLLDRDILGEPEIVDDRVGGPISESSLVRFFLVLKPFCCCKSE